MFAEEEEHPERGEGRTDVVESVRLGDTHFAEGEAEKDEGDDASEDREIGYAPKGHLDFGIGYCRLKIADRLRSFAHEPYRQEEEEADELGVEDEGE